MNGCVRVAWGEVRGSFFPWFIFFPVFPCSSSSSLTTASLCALGLAWKQMVGRGEPSLNGYNDLLIIPGGNEFLCS
jgi:hypothetical protein